MGAKCAGAPQDPQELEAAQHLENRFGEFGEVENIRKLSDVLKQMHEEVFKTPSKHPILINLGILMTQSFDEGRYKQPLTSGKKFTDTAVLMKATRYAKYAMAAYFCGEQEVDILRAIQGSEEDFDGNVEILHVHTAAKQAKGAVTCPAFFIARDKTTSDVVLSIRGSATFQDAISDAIGTTTPFMDGHAHAGLLASSQKVMEEATEHLESALKNSPNSTLAFVGHGTGAGAAILAAATKKAKCYAFSAPPVFSGELPAECSQNIYSFVYNMDMIPRTSLGSLGKLLMAVRRVDELDLDTAARVKILGGEEKAPETLPDHVEIAEELRDELKSLFGVGVVLLLFKDAKGKMNCDKVQREQMDRLLLQEDMFKDHMMPGYEEAISETLMQLHRSKGCC